MPCAHSHAARVDQFDVEISKIQSRTPWVLSERTSKVSAMGRNWTRKHDNKLLESREMINNLCQKWRPVTTAPAAAAAVRLQEFERTASERY